MISDWFLQCLPWCYVRYGHFDDFLILFAFHSLFNKTDRFLAFPYLFSGLNIKRMLMVKLKARKLIDAKPLKGPESMWRTKWVIREWKTMDYSYASSSLIFNKYITNTFILTSNDLCVPSYQRNPRNPTENYWCIVCIDIISSKNNKNSHKRGPHSHSCFCGWNHSPHCQTHCRCSKRFHSHDSTEFPESRKSKNHKSVVPSIMMGTLFSASFISVHLKIKLFTWF